MLEGEKHISVFVRACHYRVKHRNIVKVSFLCLKVTFNLFQSYDNSRECRSSPSQIVCPFGLREKYNSCTYLSFIYVSVNNESQTLNRGTTANPFCVSLSWQSVFCIEKKNRHDGHVMCDRLCIMRAVRHVYAHLGRRRHHHLCPLHLSQKHITMCADYQHVRHLIWA